MSTRAHGGIGLVSVWAALVLVAASCTGDSGPVPFRVTFNFENDRGGPRVCKQSCSAFQLDCPSRLGVRIARAEDPDVELDFRCVDTIANATTLCSLSEIEFNFNPIPLGTARVEVALWRADLLSDNQCLRGPLFDLMGEPLVTVAPQPAVAGAAFFEVGRDRVVRVPMACTFPEQIVADMCPGESLSQ